MNQTSVIGIGQTDYRRLHERSTPDLVGEAAERALADAGVETSDVDLVITGVAPDALAGWQSIERSATPAPAGVPIMRVNTGGATGAAAFLSAVEYLAAGRADVVMVVGLERMGHAKTLAGAFNTIFDPLTERDIPISTLSMAAIRACRMMIRYGYTTEGWARIAVRNFARASCNPHAQVSIEVSIEDVLSSPMIAWPIRRYDACPSSEGACVVLLTRSQLVPFGRAAARVAGHASRSTTYEIGHRVTGRGVGDLIDLPTLREATSKAYQQAGVSDVYRDVDAVEIHAPFTHAESMAYPPLGLCAADEGPDLLTEEGFAEFSRRIAINPSGGPQAANPVGATALVRIAEAARQVLGRAGDCQVQGVRTAVATGQGGANQFSTCTVLTAQ